MILTINKTTNFSTVPESTNVDKSNKSNTNDKNDTDILSPQLVKQLQARVSIFDVKKDEENFKNMLAKFI